MTLYEGLAHTQYMGEGVQWVARPTSNSSDWDQTPS